MTTKEQLRDEFDKEFPYTQFEGNLEAVVAIRDRAHTFIDQAYDRIRGESLREEEKFLEGVLHKFWHNPFTVYNCGKHLKLKGALLDRIAAIQPLTTKK